MLSKSYLMFFIFLIISCKSNYTEYSEVEIYAESYYGTKERYNESIEGFVKKDAYIYVKIENDSIINEFESISNELDSNSKFDPGQTKVLIIINTPNTKDTIILNRINSRQDKFQNIINLTNDFLPFNYQIN